MGEPCKAEDLFHGGGGDVVGGGVGDGLVYEAAESSGSAVSLCSSRSSLTDDGAESSTVGYRTLSSTSSSDTMQLDGDGDGDGGPLYEMSPLLTHLPVRTGLSKHYQGKSQSFTSLSDAKCAEDLVKMTTPYISRMKVCRGHAAAGLGANRSSISRHVPGSCCKTIAKKKTPRGSPDRVVSRARSRGLLQISGKPPVYQSKKELYRC